TNWRTRNAQSLLQQGRSMNAFEKSRGCELLGRDGTMESRWSAIPIAIREIVHVHRTRCRSPQATGRSVQAALVGAGAAHENHSATPAGGISKESAPDSGRGQPGVGADH